MTAARCTRAADPRAQLAQGDGALRPSIIEDDAGRGQFGIRAEPEGGAAAGRGLSDEEARSDLGLFNPERWLRSATT